MVPLSVIAKEAKINIYEAFRRKYESEYNTLEAVEKKLDNQDYSDRISMWNSFLIAASLDMNIFTRHMPIARIRKIFNGEEPISCYDLYYFQQLYLMKSYKVKSFDTRAYLESRVINLDVLSKEDIEKCVNAQDCENLIDKNESSIKYREWPYKKGLLDAETIKYYARLTSDRNGMFNPFIEEITGLSLDHDITTEELPIICDAIDLLYGPPVLTYRFRKAVYVLGAKLNTMVGLLFESEEEVDRIIKDEFLPNRHIQEAVIRLREEDI